MTNGNDLWLSLLTQCYRNSRLQIKKRKKESKLTIAQLLHLWPVKVSKRSWKHVQETHTDECMDECLYKLSVKSKTYHCTFINVAQRMQLLSFRSVGIFLFFCNLLRAGQGYTSMCWWTFFALANQQTLHVAFQYTCDEHLNRSQVVPSCTILINSIPILLHSIFNTTL